jgi:hypothetical protein
MSKKLTEDALHKMANQILESEMPTDTGLRTKRYELMEAVVRDEGAMAALSPQALQEVTRWALVKQAREDSGLFSPFWSELESHADQSMIDDTVRGLSDAANRQRDVRFHD